MGVSRGSSRRSAFWHGLASLLVTIMLFQLGVARSAPGDIFSIPAPVIGSDPPKASDIKDGDASVSTQTGALQYSYPIQVPPGRHGMVPHLALSYSSQAPIYGVIAAGWSLSIPEIREDTSQGRLKTHSPDVESTQADSRRDDRFVSSMAGGRPLIPVTEPTHSTFVYQTYRAQNDTSFMRYERMQLVPDPGYRWRVYATDGSTMYFGQQSRMVGCTNLGEGYAPLTGVVDAFGNEVAYEWEPGVTDGECRIKRISWGQNAAAGLSTPFAQVLFNWVGTPRCGNTEIGSQRDYRTGKLIVTGASKLASIVATAFLPGSPTAPEHTRIITLNYSAADESCTALHAPLRLLTSIQESAFGTDAPRVDLPAITFEYGDATIALRTPQQRAQIPWWIDEESRRFNLGWGYRRSDDRWPTVEAMMLDLDGDGLLDRVTNASTEATDGQCTVRWQRNQGPASDSSNLQRFGPPQTFTLPRLKWNGKIPFGSPPNSPPAGAATADPAPPHLEGCALNGQFTAFRNSHDATSCRNGTLCTLGPDNSGPFCYPDGTQCPGNGPEGPFRTYLAYRWLDMDADGLVDLVAAVHGDINVYDIVQGNNLFNGAPLPPEPDLFGPWPACPPQMDRCKAISASCTEAARVCPTDGPCTINSAALNACLASAPTLGCNALISQDRQALQILQGSPHTNPHIPTFKSPYTRCEGLYPWFIYKNQGNGVFATTPVIKYQPVQLESDFGDSSLFGPAIAAQYHGVLDFDGDGILDAIVRPSSSASYWFVWLGDGTGGFAPRRYTFPTRPAPRNLISGIGTTSPSQLEKSSEGLFDINGDGLPEHWLTSDIAPDLNANLAFHDGTQHRLTGSPPTGELETPQSPTYAVKPGNDTTFVITSPNQPVPPNQPIRAGVTTARNRTIDVDHDGRVDVVQYLPGATRPTVYFNLGGQFNAPGVEYPHAFIPGSGDFNGFLRVTKAIDDAPGQFPPPISWELSGDLMDFDGNGIAEAAYFGSDGFVRAQHNTNAPPPRLLYRIHNGRGAHTKIQYASMHDPEAVEQHPEQTWSDSRPKASPHTQWVVKRLTVLDDFAATTSTTSQFYKNPRHGADDQGHYAFRGFEEVTTTAPSGAKTVQRYGYAPDWSGRLITTLVHPAEAPAEVRSIDKTTWVERQLFNGAIKTYHGTISEHFTCANGQTETTCTATAAPGYTKTISNLSPLGSNTQTGGPKLLWAETTSVLQSGTSAADGDRQTLTRYVLHANATTYRLRLLTSTSQHRIGGTMTTFAKAAKTWDPTYRVPLTNEVWFDTQDANRAITRSEYDMTTGNLKRRWKPKQNAANTKYTTFTYDARKLFVSTEVNEVGHQFDYTYEYGTGTKLQTDGPNERACTSNCPTDAIHLLKEQRKIRVDGLGRPIERWETTSDDGNIYTLYQFDASSYVDTLANATMPTSVTHRQRLDIPASAPWREEKTELDGHGRPIKTTVFAQGSAPNDQVTTFRYRHDGTLETVSVPDPTANNATLVSYAYGFDSLGRATSLRRPDAAASTDQSGVDIVYDGMTQTTSEVVGAAGGQAAVTKTLRDKFGRLIDVHEQTAASPATWAVTHYTYGPDDRVATVVDPQNVKTVLSHNFAGHRTQIARHGRTWTYRYDKNGNLIAEQVTGSTGPATDPNYTNTIMYDDLDRPLSKVIGKRNLSPADLALFGVGTEKFTWDYGPNHKGYLRYWQAFAPGATAPTITVDLFNNNQGRRTNTAEILTIAGYPELSRSFTQTYYLFGGVRTTRHCDYVNGTNETLTQTLYDARLLPSKIMMTAPLVQDIAVQTRNVAGLVTKRRTNTTDAMPFVESNWTYDKLGRITSQTVQKGPGPTQVVRQDLNYFGNDDPKTLTHSLGTMPQQFQYGYDFRHQLTSVTTATAGYFNAHYTYGPGGRFERVAEAQPLNPLPAGTEVKPRDVSYVYGGTDPEQVTALTNVSDGQTYARYTYDAAGNQITRTYPATNESWDYVYDGKDQLRRATKKLNGVVQGSEEYWYDHDGQRIAIVKRNAAGAKTELIWLIGGTEAHYDGAGTITHIYSHLSMGTPVARVDRTGNATTALEYQFHGLASNVLAAVDQDGTISGSFSYAPFGELVEATGSATHKRRLNDKYQDELTDLGYYGVRFYDKTLIAWSQGDPLYRFAPDSAWITPRRALLYTFDINNPLRYVDPDGRSPTETLRWGLDIFRSAPPHPITKAAGTIALGLAVVGASAEIVGDRVVKGARRLFGGPLITVVNQARRMAEAKIAAAAATASQPGNKPDEGVPEEIVEEITKPIRVPKGTPGPEPGIPWPRGTPPQGTPLPGGNLKEDRAPKNPLNQDDIFQDIPQYGMSIPQSSRPKVEFDIPCLSCSILRERSRNRFDKEAEEASQIYFPR
ncbi:toxin TcdB middle/N-terminal domain-containing protein [Methylobacter sp.]|uniref:toxin TcdB middle/N-terminal domain-containing protein n=1 Tax=Methylobacter sp. TaxID=2051955 RepID=UPI003DA353C9